MVILILFNWTTGVVTGEGGMYVLRLSGVSDLEENGEGTIGSSDEAVGGGGDGISCLIIWVKGTRYWGW